MHFWGIPGPSGAELGDSGVGGTKPRWGIFAGFGDFVGILLGFRFCFDFFAGAVTYKFAFAAIRGFALLSICSTLAVLAQGISRGPLDVRKRDYRERQVRGRFHT